MTHSRVLAAGVLGLALAACATARGPAPLRADDYTAILSNTGRTAEDMKDDAARKPAQVLEFARIRPGQTIFEMEVGRGWYTDILSTAVGPTGHITTQNAPEFSFEFAAMAERRKAGRLKNVTETITHFDQLQAPDASADVVLWILGPHEVYYVPKGSTGLGDPHRAFAEIVRVLKPGGELIAMDHAAEPGTPPFVSGALHRIDPAVVLKLAAEAGLKYDARSYILANPTDDRSKIVFDSTVRRHTDQFLFRFYKAG